MLSAPWAWKNWQAMMTRVSYETRVPVMCPASGTGTRTRAPAVYPMFDSGTRIKTQFVARKATRVPLVYRFQDLGTRVSHQQPARVPVYPPYRGVHGSRVWANGEPLPRRSGEGAPPRAYCSV